MAVGGLVQEQQVLWHVPGYSQPGGWMCTAAGLRRVDRPPAWF